MKFLQTLILIFGLTVFANGQNAEKTFVLSGKVFDSEKAVVPVTEVTAENKDGRKFQTTSDENGTYKLSVPFGEYTITFNKEGFKKSTFINVENQSLAERKLNVSLELRSCYDCDGFILPEDSNVKKNPKGVKLLSTAVLSGTVYDPAGSVIQNCKITAVNQKGEKFVTFSDEDGVYTLNLPVKKFTQKKNPLLTDFIEEKYDISAQTEGFRVTTIKNFVFIASQFGKMQLDIALELGINID